MATAEAQKTKKGKPYRLINGKHKICVGKNKESGRYEHRTFDAKDPNNNIIFSETDLAAKFKNKFVLDNPLLIGGHSGVSESVQLENDQLKAKNAQLVKDLADAQAYKDAQNSKGEKTPSAPDETKVDPQTTTDEIIEAIDLSKFNKPFTVLGVKKGEWSIDDADGELILPHVVKTKKEANDLLKALNKATEA